MNILVTIKPEQYMTSSHLYSILAEINWERQEVIRTLKIPAASYRSGVNFMAPLGGGLCKHGNKILFGGWNFVVEVNYDTFEITNVVSHPWMNDLHGIHTDGKDIWIASTGIDSVLCLDSDTYNLKWRWGPDEKILCKDRKASIRNGKTSGKLLFSKFIHLISGNQKKDEPICKFVDKEYRYLAKKETNYHFHHLNDVFLWQDNLYITTKGWEHDGSRSAVIKLDPLTKEANFLVSPGGFLGMHDGVFLNENLYVTESAGNSVAWLQPNGTIIRQILEPSPYFVRGLCYTGDSFLVGFTTQRDSGKPALICEYDKDFINILSKMDISHFYPNNLGVAIHSICLA